MAGLGFHLRSNFHELLFCNLALVHDLVTLLIGKMCNLTHLLGGLGLILIEDGDIIFEVVAESISRLNRVANGLEGLKAGSLVF